MQYGKHAEATDNSVMFLVSSVRQYSVLLDVDPLQQLKGIGSQILLSGSTADGISLYASSICIIA